MKISNFALMLIFSLNIFSAEANANQAVEACGVQLNSFIRMSMNVIKESLVAENNILSCEELKIAADLNTDTLAITSGRTRGKYTICLSDERENPCKILLGVFKDSQNPSDMLSKLFKIKVEQKGQLNETVERLFLTPSSLIK